MGIRYMNSLEDLYKQLNQIKNNCDNLIKNAEEEVKKENLNSKKRIENTKKDTKILFDEYNFDLDKILSKSQTKSLSKNLFETKYNILEELDSYNIEKSNVEKKYDIEILDLENNYADKYNKLSLKYQEYLIQKKSLEDLKNQDENNIIEKYNDEKNKLDPLGDFNSIENDINNEIINIDETVSKMDKENNNKKLKLNKEFKTNIDYYNKQIIILQNEKNEKNYIISKKYEDDLNKIDNNYNLKKETTQEYINELKNNIYEIKKKYIQKLEEKNKTDIDNEKNRINQIIKNLTDDKVKLENEYNNEIEKIKKTINNLESKNNEKNKYMKEIKNKIRIEEEKFKKKKNIFLDNINELKIILDVKRKEIKNINKFFKDEIEQNTKIEYNQKINKIKDKYNILRNTFVSNDKVSEEDYNKYNNKILDLKLNNEELILKINKIENNITSEEKLLNDELNRKKIIINKINQKSKENQINNKIQNINNEFQKFNEIYIIELEKTKKEQDILN